MARNTISYNLFWRTKFLYKGTEGDEEIFVLTTPKNRLEQFYLLAENRQALAAVTKKGTQEKKKKK